MNMCFHHFRIWRTKSTNFETQMEKMDKQLSLLNKHEDEIKDLNEKTNAVGCFDQKLCALEQHLHLRINEIKAEFTNKLQEQCIYNAKKQFVQNENEELHKENENLKKKISELYEKKTRLLNLINQVYTSKINNYIRKTTN